MATLRAPAIISRLPAQAAPPALGQTLLSLLVTEGLLSQEQAYQAADAAAREKAPLTRVLTRDGYLLSRDLATVLALRLGLPMISLRNTEISHEAVRMMPEEAARRYIALPISAADACVQIAMADPGDLEALQDIQALMGREIAPVIAMQEDILEHIDIVYRLSSGVSGPNAMISAGKQQGRVTATDLRTARPSEIIDRLVLQALYDRASDIHMEATDAFLRVRYRIDGILHDVLRLSKEMQPALISRLKIMSGMNIAERRRSQDGQFSLEVNDRKVDVRVAVARTIHGEMAVLRLLDKEFTPRGLDRLGMGETALKAYRRLLRLPHGMIIVCGPTGSGKSTTLYASTLQVNRAEQNVISLEDPVEYHIADTNQMQMQPQAGITFPSQLRSTLRLDPDVILVGEIRDQETAVIATQAALTGHLVLTSLHANDSVSALLRMRDLGVPPYLIASSVAGIVSQRMVRVVCNGCAVSTERPIGEQEAYFEEMGERRTAFTYGAGCNVCARTGYRGRTGVFEALTVTEGLRALFLADAPRQQLLDQALRDGMTMLRRDGMLKVREGVTTPYEVMRVMFSLD